MLSSPTRPVTPESSWVPGRLPRPTRHPISFFFPSLYTQVLLYGDRSFFPSPYTQKLLYGNKFFFLRHTHKYCSTVVGFFSFAIYTNTARSVPFLFHFAHGSLKKLSLRR